jgi:RNA polymerase sigma-70 factor, ECF subfamily
MAVSTGNPEPSPPNHGFGTLVGRDRPRLRLATFFDRFWLIRSWSITGRILMTDFARLLETKIPNLRRYARALTRDAWRADDLVQSCLVRAVAKQHLWQPGTDLRAWLFTILHNQHVNDVRCSVREGVTVPIENTASLLTVEPTVEASLQLRDLNRAFGRLPDEQRQVLLLIGLEGMRYEEAAATLGIPLGTVRSRVSRGRETLRVLLDMREEEVVATQLRPAILAMPAAA